MNDQNPFGPLQDKFHRLSFQERSVERWEAARVEWMLKRMNELEQLREWKSRSSEFGPLKFQDFNQTFSRFPFQFVAESLVGLPPIDTDKKSFHPRWFSDFTGLPFVERYADHLDAWRKSHDKRHLAMVFPRFGIQQGLVLHNGGIDYIPVEVGAHVFRTRGRRQVIVVVQTFASLIDHIVGERNL